MVYAYPTPTHPGRLLDIVDYCHETPLASDACTLSSTGHWLASITVSTSFMIESKEGCFSF